MNEVELRDQRLDPRERVFGIVVGNEPRAYALSELRAAEAPVHDMVAGNRIEVGVETGQPQVAGSSAAIDESSTTDWAAWASLHPDTSLWRVPAVAEPDAVRSPHEIRVREFRGYRTALGCGLVQAQLAAESAPAPGLYVISGTIENVAAESVNHVVLRYEFIDDGDRVVYRDEGYNRSAEALAAPKLVSPGAVIPISSGATDSFRMIFLFSELPPFDSARVTVARVY